MPVKVFVVVSSSQNLLNTETTSKLTDLSVSCKVIDCFLCTNFFEFYICCSDCTTNGLSRTTRYFARFMSERRCISLLVLTMSLPCESWAYRTAPTGLRHEMSICLHDRLECRPFDKPEYSSLYFDMSHFPCINQIHNI